jgi:hypothetical protein
LAKIREVTAQEGRGKVYWWWAVGTGIAPCGAKGRAMLLGLYLQVSDLHFRESPEGVLAPWARKLAKKFRKMDGLLGHDRRATEALEELLQDLRVEGVANDVTPEVIASGDLTQVGKEGQFRMAAHFLGEPILPGSTEPTFRFTEWQDRTVPGNHDHWPEKFPIPPKEPHVILRALFPWAAAPDGYSTRPPKPLKGGYSLRVVLLNTDAGIDPFTWDGFKKRVLAVGDFNGVLAALPPPQAAPKEIRVLVLHHSPSIPRGTTMYISDPSLTQLRHVVHDHGFRVVLTGHSHEFLLNPTALGPVGLGGLIGAIFGGGVFEARCGTSSQLTNPRAEEKDALGIGPEDGDRPGDGDFSGHQPNTALVHRLVEDTAAGKVWWETEVRMLMPDTGSFEPLPQNFQGMVTNHRVAVSP